MIEFGIRIEFDIWIFEFDIEENIAVVLKLGNILTMNTTMHYQSEKLTNRSDVPEESFYIISEGYLKWLQERKEHVSIQRKMFFCTFKKNRETNFVQRSALNWNW